MSPDFRNGPAMLVVTNTAGNQLPNPQASSAENPCVLALQKESPTSEVGATLKGDP